MAIIDDMDMEEYHDEISISSTNLRDMETSCELANYNKTNRRNIKQTQAMFEGTLIHHALQTRNIGSAYAIAPECDRRTKHGKAEYAEFQSRIGNLSAITRYQYDMATGAMESAWSHPESRLFLENGLMERSGFTKLMDVAVKARPDIDCSQIPHSKHFPALIDIKTRQLGKASRESWSKDFFNYKTYLQAGLQILVWRSLGCEVTEYYYLLVEKDPPYQVNVIALDKDWIHESILQVHKVLEKWKTYLANGLPKSYGRQAPLEVEDWQKRILDA